MSDTPPTPTENGDGPPQGERRLASRVRIEGFAFKTDAGTYTVVDLSIGGIRLARLADRPVPEAGATLAGTLTGAGAGPIPLTAQVLWIDPDTGQIGCTFPVLGRHIAGDLLEILL